MYLLGYVKKMGELNEFNEYRLTFKNMDVSDMGLK